MATVNKNFRVKNGLTVEGNVTITGTNGTINSSNILTEATVAYPNVFATISANGTSVVADTSTDTLTLTPGTGIEIVGNATSDTITITNSDLGSAQNIFKTFIANGTSIVAANNSDTITITPSTGITIAGNATSDTITITNSGVTGLTGTANEIEVSGSTGSVTIGLPNDVTIGNNLTVTGNLTVSGTTTTLNTDTLAVEDNIVVLNSNITGTPTLDAGIEVERGDYTNAKIYWSETNNAWYLSTPGDSAGAATDAAIATGGSTNLFNTISDGSNTATPDSGNDTLTFAAGTGLTVVVNGTTDTVTYGLDANATASVLSVTLPNSKIEDGTVTAAGTSVNIDTFTLASYKSAKYVVQMTNAGGDAHLVEVLVTAVTTNAYVVEYAELITNTSLGDVTADSDGTTVTVSVGSTASGVVVKHSVTYIEA